MGVQRKGRLKEQFINGIYNDDMMTEIIRELTNKKANEITSEQVLSWARRVETQRVHKALIKTKGNKDFTTMKKQEQKNNSLNKAKEDRTGMYINYKYCGNTHELQRDNLWQELFEMW